MLVVASLSHISGILTFGVLLVSLVYLVRIRRALVCLIGAIADRHVEVRSDLKNARDARERQHKETLQAFSTVTGELKQLGSLAQTATEALKEPDARKTMEMAPLPIREEAGPTKEQPPTVRGAKLQASATPEGDVKQGDGERPSETDGKTLVWSGVPSGRTLVGLGASASSPGTVGGCVGAGASGG